MKNIILADDAGTPYYLACFRQAMFGQDLGESHQVAIQADRLFRGGVGNTQVMQDAVRGQHLDPGQAAEQERFEQNSSAGEDMAPPYLTNSIFLKTMYRRTFEERGRCRCFLWIFREASRAAQIAVVRRSLSGAAG